MYVYDDNINFNPASVSISGAAGKNRLKANNQVVFTKEQPSNDAYLSVSSDALSGFTYAQGEGPSLEQSIAIIGRNLSSNLSVTMPAGYEVSSDGSSYASSLSLTPADGSLQQMLYVRLAANLIQGNYNGNMTLTSNSTNIMVSLSGEVTDGSVVQQTFELGEGWNWWSPNIEITLQQLEVALGTSGIEILSQDDKSVTYNTNNNTWSGDLTSIEPGKMYKIHTSAACSISFSGEAINPTTFTITLTYGNNWIGFIGTQSMTLEEALNGITPTDRDVIKSSTGKATYYEGYGWQGTLHTLEPGVGYIYKSNARGDKRFTYPKGK